MRVLDLSYRDLESLDGIEFDPGLKKLYLDLNQITDLTPLAALTRLRKLYLGDNQITDLTPLAELTGLKTLYFRVHVGSICSY